VTAALAAVATRRAANRRHALNEDFVAVYLVPWTPMWWMTRGKMSGLLPPEPVPVVMGISIDARPKMMPAIQELAFVLTPKVSKWLERDHSA